MQCDYSISITSLEKQYSIEINCEYSIILLFTIIDTIIVLKKLTDIS